jgi:hypothetical protein
MLCRTAVFALLVALICPGTSSAQSSDGSKKLIKIAVGASALVVGAAVAAKSSQTTTVNGPAGQTRTTSFSKSQLTTGLVVAGAGGLVLWSGLKQHRNSPSVSVEALLAPRGAAVFLRRAW